MFDPAFVPEMEMRQMVEPMKIYGIFNNNSVEVPLPNSDRRSSWAAIRVV